jgi:hypothetical protein
MSIDPLADYVDTANPALSGSVDEVIMLRTVWGEDDDVGFGWRSQRARAETVEESGDGSLFSVRSQIL